MTDGSSMTLPVHTEAVEARLKLISEDSATIQRRILELANQDSAIFPLDLVAFGAAKRHCSSSAAMAQLVSSWNMVTARALLRIHIDTALRFSAAWMVDDPQDFAQKIWGGERIDKMKDRDGVRLTDQRLIESHTAAYPWLKPVYEQLCGYVHFSSSHISGAVSRGPSHSGDRRVSFEFSGTDYNFPETSWLEVLDCFRSATALLDHYLQGYAVTKSMTPEELSSGRSKPVHR